MPLPIFFFTLPRHIPTKIWGEYPPPPVGLQLYTLHNKKNKNYTCSLRKGVTHFGCGIGEGCTYQPPYILLPRPFFFFIYCSLNLHVQFIPFNFHCIHEYHYSVFVCVCVCVCVCVTGVNPGGWGCIPPPPTFLGGGMPCTNIPPPHILKIKTPKIARLLRSLAHKCTLRLDLCGFASTCILFLTSM